MPRPGGSSRPSHGPSLRREPVAVCITARVVPSLAQVSGDSTAPASACPDEAVIAEFVTGELPADRVPELEAHLDGCEACSQVVAGLVSIFDDGPPAAEPEAPDASDDGDGPMLSEEMAVTLGPADQEEPQRPLGVLMPAGAGVGRYRVLECVGVGGMGVVYSAYDPELDRRVALKLLRGSHRDPDSADRNARLLREAQALAKLSHPNVITVHDVGTWEEQVFMAMEYIDGPSLKEWLAQEQRSWPEIREVFVAAGRGLAAAHAVGLVHRDFKPDNVLIGSDRRVRVTDFGLARWGPLAYQSTDMVATDQLPVDDLPSGPMSGSGSSRRNPVVSLTQTGTLVGTPAYMSPEQYEQSPADAASDQFAFCVALFEAVYRERPFAGRTIAELASNVMEGRVAEAGRAVVVPRVVRQALRRGLSRQRGDRFASMDHLLSVLDHRPVRRFRAGVMVGAPLLALGAGVWAYSQAEPARTGFCRTERGLTEVWSPTRREAIRTTFVGTELAYAPDMADRALSGVDEYVQDWEQLRALSCRPQGATDEGPGVAALRERCLSRRKVALDTLLTIFEGADASTVRRAVGAVAGLPPLEGCAEADALTAELPPPVPVALRNDVESVRDDKARSDGLRAAGRYAEALTLARELDARAEALGHKPLRAEMQLLLGQMLDFSGDAEAANEALEQAVLLAAASRHRRVLVRALVARVYVLGMGMPHFEQAQQVARWAEAEIEGLRMEDEALSALLLNRGSVTYRQGDLEGAAELFRRAMALRDRDQEPMRWADAAFNVATMELLLGHHDVAIAGLEDYVEVFEQALGERHPEVGSGYQNLGIAYSNAGRTEEARDTLEKAEKNRRESLGTDHPLYAGTINSLGAVWGELGDSEKSLAFSRRSIEILEAVGDDPVEVATNRVNLAEALASLGRLDEAERETLAALIVIKQGMGEDNLSMAPGYAVLAAVAAGRGNVQGVQDNMDLVQKVRRGQVEPAEFLRSEVERARYLALAGAADTAIEVLNAVITEAERLPPDLVVPAARFELAGVLWESSGVRREARTLAAKAQMEFRMLGLSGLSDVAGEWLESHPL